MAHDAMQEIRTTLFDGVVHNKEIQPCHEKIRIRTNFAQLPHLIVFWSASLGLKEMVNTLRDPSHCARAHLRARIYASVACADLEVSLQNANVDAIGNGYARRKSLPRT
jgi:hypothetical protein